MPPATTGALGSIALNGITSHFFFSLFICVFGDKSAFIKLFLSDDPLRANFTRPFLRAEFREADWKREITLYLVLTATMPGFPSRLAENLLFSQSPALVGSLFCASSTGKLKTSSVLHAGRLALSFTDRRPFARRVARCRPSFRRRAFLLHLRAGVTPNVRHSSYNKQQ